MSTGTRSSKTTAKRSTAKRSSTPRTTSGGNGNVEPKVEDVKKNAEDEAAATVELSKEDVLAAAITEDGSRIFDLETGKELKGDERVSHLFELQTKGIKLAKRAKAKFHDFHLANGELATLMLDIRESTMMPDGIPDWFGGSETYKKLVSPIIDEAFTDGEDTRPTVVNRLQKRCSRMAQLRIANYTNTKHKLGLDEEEIQRILQLEEKATEGDEAKNEKTQKFVAAVNQQYRVSATEVAGNRQKSPFVGKTAGGGGGGPGTLTPEEQKAVDAANNVPLFRNAIQHLTAEKYLPELVALCQEIRKTLVAKKNPAFGDAGIQGAVGHLRNAEVIIHATGKELDGHKLDKDEKEAVELAMKAA